MVNQKAFIFRLASNVALFAIFLWIFGASIGGNALVFAVPPLSNVNTAVPSGVILSKTQLWPLYYFF